MAEFEAKVLIKLELDGNVDDAQEAVDVVMQRAWDTDNGRRWLDQKWSFSVPEGCVTDVTKEEADA